MKVAELFAELGFKVDDTGLQKFQTGLKGARDSLLSMKSAIAAAGITFMGHQALAAAKNLDALQKKTGMGVLQLQRLKVLSAQSSLSMGDLASAMEKASKGEPISKEALSLIEKSRYELKDFNEQIFLTNKEKTGMIKLSQTFAKIKETLAIVIQKVIAKLVPALQKIADVVKKVAFWFYQIFEAIDAVIQATIGWEKLLLGLVVVFGAISLATKPISLIITGILLIIEDIYTHMQGGDSVFGIIIGFVKNIASIIKREIIDPIMGAISSVSSIGSKVSGFFGGGKKEGGGGFLSGIGDSVMGMAGSFFGMGGGSPMAAAGGGGSTQTNNVSINVNSSSANPEQVASEVKSAFDQEKERADFQLNNSGV